MKFQDLINININYTRSINFERDADSFSIVESYLPTSRALSTFHRIANGFNKQNNQRAFALIGPYGTGKSAFAVFLAHLLGSPDNKSTVSARKILENSDRQLFDRVCTHTNRTQGYLPVLITGTPEPLAKRFVKSLYQAADKYWIENKVANHWIVSELKECVDKQLSIQEIMNLVHELQSAISKSGRGILIVFDELGKFLEYEARHYGANDIYLLQALAEHSNKGVEANLLVAVLMHQGFDQYARGLGKSLRDEWSKVQGRYENIPFLETIEQTLRIVATAFTHNLKQNQHKKILTQCITAASVLNKQNALPGKIDGKEAAKLFKCCYPLHPIASLVLPVLCQRLAQNERTLFSYLGSNEPYGFKDNIKNLANVGDFVPLWTLYDYFICNQPAVLTNPSTHRRWAEVVTALERLGDAPPKEIELVKTIGLLNIIGAQAGLKASQAVVELCFPVDGEINQTLISLTQKSIIQFRKYSSEYRVWEGSDFDLEAATQDELNQITHFNLSESLNERKALPSIVARRHTIEKGTLRYFETCFVDPVSYSKQPISSSTQRIIFCLVETLEDKEVFHEKVISYYSNQDIVVLWSNSDQLREATAEVLALERVQINCSDLHSDPVAMREYKDSLTTAEQTEDELLSAFIETPENGTWYWSNEILHIHNKRQLQQELSEILNKIYYASPVFKNELINREKPSSQAIGARNKLITAIFNNVDKQDLDIEKYAAEKGIYLALLKASGLHRKVDGIWQLTPPDKDDDPQNIYPVWDKITIFLQNTEEKPLSFFSLNEVLKAPPFGVKDGVLHILYVTAFLCYQYELSLYEDNVYTPYVTEQHIERFVKRPDCFTVQRFRINGLRATIFKQYVKALYGDTKKSMELIYIIKPLAKFINELPEYTKNTENLSQISQDVRRVLEIAKSPEEVLFNILPKACGFGVIDLASVDEENLKGFSDTLMCSLKELKYAFTNLKIGIKKVIAQILLISNNDDKVELLTGELRYRLLERFNGLSQYTVDTKGLRPFLLHICKTGVTDDYWLESLLLFLSKKPANKWTDIDRDGVELKLAEYSRRLFDLQCLQIAHEKKSSTKNKDYDTILLKAMRHGKTENELAICINSTTQKKMVYQKKIIVANLKKIEPELRLAILAEIVDECLEESRKSDRKKDKIKKRNISE